MKNKIISKILLISVIIGILTLGGVALCSAENIIKKPPMPAPIDIKTIQKTKTYNVEHTGYKNIKPYLNYYQLQNNIATFSLINKIYNIEENIQEYLNNDTISKIAKEKMYILYMKNLSFYATCINEFNLDDVPIDTPINWNYSHFEYSLVHYVIQDGQISFDNPYCKSIKLAHAGEGFIAPIIDAEFQYKLSLYLDTVWQNYWQIRLREQKDLNGSARIYSDGSRTIKLNTLAEWITAWSKFQKQNTKTELSEDIEERINSYLDAFMSPSVYDYDNWGEYIGGYDYTIQNPTRPLTVRGRAEFERLLNNLPKDTHAYKVVNKAYNILKNNNYTTSEEYYNAFQKSDL